MSELDVEVAHARVHGELTERVFFFFCYRVLQNIGFHASCVSQSKRWFCGACVNDLGSVVYVGVCSYARCCVRSESLSAADHVYHETA